MKKLIAVLLTLAMLAGALLMVSAEEASTGLYMPEVLERNGQTEPLIKIPADKKSSPDVTDGVPAYSDGYVVSVDGTQTDVFGTDDFGGGIFFEKFSMDDDYIYYGMTVNNTRTDGKWYGDMTIKLWIKPTKVYTDFADYFNCERVSSIAGTPRQFFHYDAVLNTTEGFYEGTAGWAGSTNTYAQSGAEFYGSGTVGNGKAQSYEIKISRKWMEEKTGLASDAYAFYVRACWDQVRYGDFMNDAVLAELGQTRGGYEELVPRYLILDKGDATTSEKASVRISAEHNGLRFKTQINNKTIAALQAQYGVENVSVGTLIAPTDTLGGAKLTHEFAGKKLDVPAKVDAPFAEGDLYNTYAGSITDLNDYNLDRDFTAVGYIKVVDGENVSYIYSKVAASRSVAYVAEQALKDAESYTSTQLELIQALIPAKVEA